MEHAGSGVDWYSLFSVIQVVVMTVVGIIAWSMRKSFAAGGELQKMRDNLATVTTAVGNITIRLSNLHQEFQSTREADRARIDFDRECARLRDEIQRLWELDGLDRRRMGTKR